jgi:molybdopterin-containing oxidoreductase family iron-sulfur binding subunit
MTPATHHAPLTSAADGPPALARRTALKLLASGAAVALASCGRPPEEIVPYVEMPERLTPGVPLRFATTLPLSGYGRGVIVTSHEGRPTKVDGNPRHPASLGATDIFAEAAVLSLYDPDRLKSVRKGDELTSWSAFEAALLARMEQARARHGAGLRILSNRITSQTLLAQIDALLKTLPEARWYRYEPIDDDAARFGAAQAFGRPATVVPRFADARVVLALDADPLGVGPEQIRYARDVASARRTHDPQQFLRLYAAEPVTTLTGAAADHRVAVTPALVRNIALAIAHALGATVPDAALPDDASRFAQAVADDLKAHNGQALVLAGRRQPAEVHALCHWINGQLRAPVDLIAPVDPATQGHGEALRTLADEIHGGQVQSLLILGANPAYDAPGALGLADAIGSVSFSARLGLYDDETAIRCTWRLPQSHPLESWSDLRAYDGTASIVQPLIRPLYDSRTAHDVLALLGTGAGGSAHDLVRQTWQAHAPGDFATWWRQTLQNGVVGSSAAKPMAAPAVAVPQITPATVSSALTLVLGPDPSLGDGTDANNAWLQECPKPFDTQVWGNALCVAAPDARSLALREGDVVRLRHGDRSIEAPVRIGAGQAPGVIAATLGYGRSRAGVIGNGIGFDVHPLRDPAAPWVLDGIEMARTGKRQDLLSTQHAFRLDGEDRELQPRLTLAQLAQGATAGTRPDAAPPSLYPPRPPETYAWAMAIDTTACIGCNACVVACQSENNVPVVGPEEIAVGRDMHWLRVDSYVVDGRPGFSPVPCMHCEHAPCEPVCPVAASIHDSDGLNVQVYNRCVGTRFCESNCPYKVRRFNFFGYADGQEYANLGADTVKAAFNPDVTVRARGVMEKCTYCVQRISRARRAAEKEDRAIRDGEMVTACQAACPTQAISFGNLRDSTAAVHGQRNAPHAYALLGELGTRPRTTYLARLRNPNPAFGEAQS